MLNIARKIAEGMSYQSEGYVLGEGKGGEMAGGWESEENWEEEMDDYGVRIGNGNGNGERGGRRSRRMEGEVGGSWEID